MRFSTLRSNQAALPGSRRSAQGASGSAAAEPGRSTGPLLWLICVADASLLVASGLIHLHLWDIAYRDVRVLDVLFLVQAGAAILTLSLTAAIMVRRGR